MVKAITNARQPQFPSCDSVNDGQIQFYCKRLIETREGARFSRDGRKDNQETRLRTRWRRTERAREHRVYTVILIIVYVHMYLPRKMWVKIANPYSAKMMVEDNLSKFKLMLIKNYFEKYLGKLLQVLPHFEGLAKQSVSKWNN